MEVLDVDDFHNCNQSDLDAETGGNLLHHIETVHSASSRDNIIDGNNGNGNDAMAGDIEGSSTIKEKIIVCAVCDLHFIQEEEYLLHISSHSKAAIRCEECNFTYNTKLDLEWHIETEHEEINTEEFKCSACPFVGSTLAELETHKVRAESCFRMSSL